MLIKTFNVFGYTYFVLMLHRVVVNLLIFYFGSQVAGNIWKHVLFFLKGLLKSLSLPGKLKRWRENEKKKKQKQIKKKKKSWNNDLLKQDFWQSLVDARG